MIAISSASARQASQRQTLKGVDSVSIRFEVLKLLKYVFRYLDQLVMAWMKLI